MLSLDNECYRLPGTLETLREEALYKSTTFTFNCPSARGMDDHMMSCVTIISCQSILSIVTVHQLLSKVLSYGSE